MKDEQGNPPELREPMRGLDSGAEANPTKGESSIGISQTQTRQGSSDTPESPSQSADPDSAKDDAHAAAASAENAPDPNDTEEDDNRERLAADEAIRVVSRRNTRRAFLTGGAAAAAGYGFYRWLNHSRRDEMQPVLLRRAFQANAAIFQKLYAAPILAPTYSLNRAENLRVNGVFGLKRMLDPESWRLQLVGARNASDHPRFTKDVTAWEYRYVEAASKEDQGHDTKVDPKMLSSLKMAPASMQQKAQQDENHTGRMPRGLEEAGESRSTLRPGTPGLLLTMDDLRRFPRQELVTQFKCIEGWSQIVHWAGIRLADFLEAYPPELIGGREPRYVYMETPDGDYYTGYDLEVCRHPQALLVTEMMGAPLTQFHGAPLRLHMPTKYGYKQIKRIGLISYTDQKPDDYWTKLGYDWYAGL